MLDVIVVGGSYAGLAAALQLGRARRSVLVLDAGQRRNRFAHESHGFIGRDGQSPEAIAAEARADVTKYPTVTVTDVPATQARAIAGGFAVTAGSEEHQARRLVLATGIADDLPAIPGLAEQWGRRSFFCPYCHAYELGGRLGILAANAYSVHQAIVVSDWAAKGQAHFFLHDAPQPSAEELAELESRGIAIVSTPIARLSEEGGGVTVHLQDERAIALDGFFLYPTTRFPSTIGEQLGCELEAGKLGLIYKTDPLTKETSVPGVFACGDAALPAPNITFAAADGVRAGVAAHQSLVFRREQTG